MSDLPPPLPTKVSREQARAAKERRKQFQIALKAYARSHGWRYIGGEIFRQDGEWFASALSFPASENGEIVHFSLKPMALDPLFWEIVGLPENSKLPLSFRANGAWVLRPPHVESLIDEINDVSEVAELIVTWADEKLTESRATRSIERMLHALPEPEELDGQLLAVAVCLHILAKDLDAAWTLCEQRQDSRPPGDGGGFLTCNADGTLSSFIDQARNWIIATRRSSIRLV